MKKIFTCALILMTTSVFAQTTVYDSVSMGAGYANQVFYSLQDGEVAQAPNTNWELAFTTYFMGAAAFTNSAQGVAVFMIPSTDINGFTAVDTTNYSSWQMLNNSDVTWDRGALNNNMTNHPNYGWGDYSTTTNEVVGDSLFLVRMGTAPNYIFKKLWLIKKDISGSWIIRYADIDNNNDVTDTILYNNYIGKNFSYYSLTSQSELNREPLSADWDITFTRYTANVTVAGCIPSTGFFPVTGALTNKKVVSAQANVVDYSAVDFTNYQSQLDSNISIIGYDWKCSGQLIDSIVYFVKTTIGAVWKLQFTAPAPSFSTGKIYFKRELLIPSAVSTVGNDATNFYVYPNPSSGNSTLIVDSKLNENATFCIYNASGALINKQLVSVKSGLNAFPLQTQNLDNGIYFIKQAGTNNSLNIKLVIAR